jgi:hypothetical protein
MEVIDWTEPNWNMGVSREAGAPSALTCDSGF